MITLILSGQTTPLRPRDEAMAHLKSVHGPMVYDAPADAGAMPSVYVQNHVLRDLALPVSLEAARWDRDLVTEISFQDVAHLKASIATPYYIERLKPDEGRFVDQTTVRPLVVTTETRGVERSPGMIKLFVYLAAAGDLEIFDHRWNLAVIAAADACVKQALNRPLRQAFGAPPFVDGVWSLWFADAAQAEAFCAALLPALLVGFGESLDRSASRILLAEEFSVDRLRRENAVSQTKAISA